MPILEAGHGRLERNERGRTVEVMSCKNCLIILSVSQKTRQKRHCYLCRQESVTPEEIGYLFGNTNQFF